MKKVTHPGISKGNNLQRNITSGLTTIYTKIKSPDLVSAQGKEASKKAFTLVELIVVITILAILGMIAFISLQGYSADARDSSRIRDINHIKTSLELQSLAAGKYPLPDNYQDVTYSGGIVAWHQGTVGENVTKILSRNLNEKPTDPLYNTEYIYSVTPTQNQFEVLSIYEGDIVYLQNPPLLVGEGLGVRLEKANATSNTVRIDGTYNGVYVKNGNYIIPTPSIITSLNPAGLELDSTTIKSQVIDRGTNVPNIGTPKITQSTGALTFSTFQVYNGELNEESSTGAFLSAYQAIANTYNGSSLADEGVIKTLLTQTTDEQKIEFTKSLILSTPTGGSSGTDTGTTPTYSCTGILPTQNVSTSNNTGLTADIPWQNTNSGNHCYYECNTGYTGANCDTKTGWWALDSNCNIPDIPIYSGATLIQVWAGCNSTLGTGFEWGIKNDGITNGTIGSCRDYDGGTGSVSDCATGLTNMLSNTSAINFFNLKQPDGINKYGDAEFDTIWGKLYTWDSLDTDNDNDIDISDTNKVCGTGYHVPSDAEWTALENYLAGTNCRTTDGWQCDGLGWKSNSSYTPDRRLVETLKIHLSGLRSTDGLISSFRGYTGHLRSSTPSPTGSNAYCRGFNGENSAIYRYPYSQLYSYAVRCIKN